MAHERRVVVGFLFEVVRHLLHPGADGGLHELPIPIEIGQGLGAEIDLARVPVLPVFRWLAQAGNVAQSEMLRTFNCGIGMVVIVDKAQADAIATLAGIETDKAKVAIDAFKAMSA